MIMCSINDNSPYSDTFEQEFFLDDINVANEICINTTDDKLEASIQSVPSTINQLHQKMSDNQKISPEDLEKFVFAPNASAAQKQFGDEFDNILRQFHQQNDPIRSGQPANNSMSFGANVQSARPTQAVVKNMAVTTQDIANTMNLSVPLVVEQSQISPAILSCSPGNPSAYFLNGSQVYLEPSDMNFQEDFTGNLIGYMEGGQGASNAMDTSAPQTSNWVTSPNPNLQTIDISTLHDGHHFINESFEHNSLILNDLPLSSTVQGYNHMSGISHPALTSLAPTSNYLINSTAASNPMSAAQSVKLSEYDLRQYQIPLQSSTSCIRQRHITTLPPSCNDSVLVHQMQPASGHQSCNLQPNTFPQMQTTARISPTQTSSLTSKTIASQNLPYKARAVGNLGSSFDSSASTSSSSRNSTPTLQGSPVLGARLRRPPRPATEPLTESDREKQEEKRKRNRDAAKKCRTRKLNHMSSLEKKVQVLSEENTNLYEKKRMLMDEMNRLRNEIHDHKMHGCLFDESMIHLHCAL